MKKSTRFFALILALTMCATMALTGALGETPSSTPEVTAAAEVTAAPDQTAAPKLPEDILATVGGKNILRSDIESIYNILYNQYSSYGVDLSSSVGYLESMALYYAIQDEVLKQKATELGFDKFTAEEETEFQTKADTDFAAFIDANYTSYLTAASDTPTEQEIADARAKVEQELATQGYTKDKAIESYRMTKMYERLEEMLMKDAPAIADEAIQTEYQTLVDADKASFDSDISAYESAASQGDENVWYVPEGVRGISHILMKVDDTLLQAYLNAKDQLAAQQNQAQALEEESVDPNPDTEATVDPSATTAAESTVAPTAEPTVEPTATPVPVTQADVDAARQAVLDSIKDKTDDIYKRLSAGEAFAALVEQYGEDPGMQQEPYKTEGYTVHQGFQGFVPEFTEGAFAPELQKVGDFGQPIVGTYGVHILSYTRDVKSGAVELNDTRKAKLLEEMQADQKNEVVSAAIEQWITAANVTYTGLVPKLEQ